MIVPSFESKLARLECRSPFDSDRPSDLRSGQAFDSVAAAASLRMTA
jgi:hypothetical protein